MQTALLFAQGRSHPDGLCEQNGTPEIIKDFMIQCSKHAQEINILRDSI